MMPIAYRVGLLLRLSALPGSIYSLIKSASIDFGMRETDKQDSEIVNSMAEN